MCLKNSTTASLSNDDDPLIFDTATIPTTTTNNNPSLLPPPISKLSSERDHEQQFQLATVLVTRDEIRDGAPMVVKVEGLRIVISRNFSSSI
ncbi:hypothetical protein L6452_06388 [Arctium lappa]|uniref:Uncharacterized protein n=1 Tax=Arctium lappa TaxID=4217 RepID=A0ACB9EK48_ARCLA|nr:hypothetical protein L6452_06388 [Arctium lappa]